MASNKVSVIIPTIGRKESLPFCVSALFTQTLKPDEIIIVDNSLEGKVKGCIPLLRDKACVPIRYTQEKRIGAAYARNKGVRIAKNTRLAFIDDDCVADKSWLRELTHLSKKYPIIRGRNEDGFKDNLFSSINYLRDESFMRSGIYNYIDDTISPWLDTKNCLIDKSVFIKKNVWFNHYLLTQDLDFTTQAHISHIPIITNNKAVVYHFGRATLLSSIIRWIKLGVDIYYLKTRGKAIKLPLYNLNMNLCQRIISRKKIIISNQIRKKIFRKKNIFYKIVFYVLLNGGYYITKCSYLVVRLLNI